MSLFTARGCSISAGGQRLLTGLSLALEPGELVALTGPSGSGKTTLLRCLSLLSDPDEGELRLRDRAPRDVGYPEWRRSVSLLPQRPVLSEATVRENLLRPFGFAVSRSGLDEDRARDLLARLSLEPSRFDQSATTLSEGQQQRVALARTLLVGPDVLLLDEPTSALDPEAVAAAEALVRERVREAGSCALVVTHDRAQAERWCDRAIAIGGADA